MREQKARQHRREVTERLHHAQVLTSQACMLEVSTDRQPYTQHLVRPSASVVSSWHTSACWLVIGLSACDQELQLNMTLTELSLKLHAAAAAFGLECTDSLPVSLRGAAQLVLAVCQLLGNTSTLASSQWCQPCATVTPP